MAQLGTRLGRILNFRPPSSSGNALRASIAPFSSAVAVASMVSYSSAVSNPVAAADAPDEARQATHHVKRSDGKTIRFKNPYPSAGEPPSAWEITSTMILGRLTGSAPAPDLSNVKIPAVKPEFLASRTGSTALRATWLGHACYLVEFPSGLRVLFDPVFEGRCAPVQWFGPKRHTPPACALSELPPVDAVVISHSHYDHLSLTSVRELAARNPEAQFFVGLGLEKWFRDNCGTTKVTEMDWWQDSELVLRRKVEAKTGNDQAPETISARITCLPSQHSSARSASDKDQTLWASFAISSGGKSVWFGGDTGYRRVPKLPVHIDDYGPEYDSLPRCPQFKQIGELRGPFDLGLIPIGAYSPRFLFSWMHANPYDAVEIFKDTRCKRAMGIHWGAWVLTNEEVEEPPRLLKDALKRSGLPETGVFDVCAIGETREF